MGWGLVLGGGTSLGAVQPAICRALIKRLGMPDVIAGTSVGSVNASKIGQGPDGLDELDQIWSAVDGTGFFQRPALDPWNGLFSLRPLRKHLERYNAATDLHVPVYVGLVDAASQRHRMVLLNELGVEDARDAVVGSSTQPVIHRRWAFRGRWVFDGGIRHVLPLLPGWEDLEQIHVLSCSPVGKDRRRERAQKDVAQVWEQGEVAFEALVSSVVAGDVLRLRRWAGSVPVHLYAPKSWEQIGRSFDASAAAILHRRRVVAPWMLAHPVVLDPC